MSGKKDYYDSNPVIELGELIFNLMILNVLWAMCSIFIVTAGAASTALNYTCIKMNREEGDSIVRLFFKSFTMNIRQALVLHTGMFIILLVLLAGLIQGLGMMDAGQFLGNLLVGGVVIVLCIWLILYTYMFMLLARFDNSLKETLRNTVYFALVEYKMTGKVLLREIAMIIAIPVILFSFLPFLFPLVIFFGVPLLAYLNAKDFNKMFDEFLASQGEN